MIVVQKDGRIVFSTCCIYVFTEAHGTHKHVIAIAWTLKD